MKRNSGRIENVLMAIYSEREHTAYLTELLRLLAANNPVLALIVEEIKRHRFIYVFVPCRNHPLRKG